jgi:hypothetical protein
VNRRDWIKTLASIATVLAAIVAMSVNWKTLMGPGPPVEASGESFYAPPGPDVDYALGFLQGTQEPNLRSVLESILKSYYHEMPVCADSSGAIAGALSQAVGSSFPDPSIKSMRAGNQLTHLDIKPRVLTACHNVKVIVSGAWAFDVSRNNQKWTISRGDQQVDLGNLQPGDSVKMYAWGSLGNGTPDIVVTSDEGAAIVKILGVREEVSVWDAVRFVTWSFALPVIGTIAIIWQVLPKNVKEQLDKALADKPDQTSK